MLLLWAVISAVLLTVALAFMIEIHEVRALTLAACGDHASALRTEAAARARQLGLIS